MPAPALEAAIDAGEVSPSTDRGTARQLAVRKAIEQRQLDDLTVQIRESMWDTGVALLYAKSRLSAEDFLSAIADLLVSMDACPEFNEFMGMSDSEYLAACQEIARLLPEPDFAKSWDEQSVSS
jgi:hypothetical protein